MLLKTLIFTLWFQHYICTFWACFFDPHTGILFLHLVQTHEQKKGWFYHFTKWWGYIRRGRIYVMVFRTYQREAVPMMTTHLLIGLALSFVAVDNWTWPSVPLGPHPGCHWFSHQNTHMHRQVSLVVMSHPPCAISYLNFHIKVDPI